MSPSSFINFLNPLRIFGGRLSFGGIHSQERFRDLLDRERSRADRTGVPFSLVVFRLKGRKRQTYHVLYNLAQLIVYRVRTSDEAGWFDKTSLGVILIGAGEAGAIKFASAILDSMPRHLTAPTFEVYVYPSAIAEPSKSSTEESPKGPAEGVLPPVFVRQLPLWKDILDVTAAVIALILLSPLFLVIAVYIKIVSPGPVFFKQERVGFRGKKFTIWKFRTMKMDNDASAHEQYLKDLIRGEAAMVKLDAKKDPRIIPLGGVLRQSGIDELPQLFNVVLGDMSLVGPRPCLPYEAKEYDQWHAERFDTIPGLTGLWQVSGKNRTTFKEMIRFDVRYARRMSLWMELQILFRTFPAVFQQIRDHRKKADGEKKSIPFQPEKEKP